MLLFILGMILGIVIGHVYTAFDFVDSPAKLEELKYLVTLLRKVLGK